METFKFSPGILPTHNDAEHSLCFLFDGIQILVTDEATLPEFPANHEILTNKDSIYLGTYENQPCYACRLNGQTIPNAHKCVEFRSLYGVVPESLYSLIGYASQILTWHTNHQYCSKCGAKAHASQTERAMVCPSCGLMNYPRISPSVIVAITKGNRLLLAHNQRFKQGLYSLIAGFVDSGETLEQCVEREIAEEVGLKVKNIRYLTSQSWPMPHSLMVGFTAEYESGEITVDQTEIDDAKWFTPDNFPIIPSKDTIARILIDHVVSN